MEQSTRQQHTDMRASKNGDVRQCCPPVAFPCVGVVCSGAWGSQQSGPQLLSSSAMQLQVSASGTAAAKRGTASFGYRIHRSVLSARPPSLPASAVHAPDWPSAPAPPPGGPGGAEGGKRQQWFPLPRLPSRPSVCFLSHAAPLPTCPHVCPLGCVLRPARYSQPANRSLSDCPVSARMTAANAKNSPAARHSACPCVLRVHALPSAARAACLPPLGRFGRSCRGPSRAAQQGRQAVQFAPCRGRGSEWPSADTGGWRGWSRPPPPHVTRY
jgi:hypothetical protein